MDYFDLNMECIKVNHKELYQGISGIDHNHLDNHFDEIDSVATRSNEKAVVVKCGSVVYRLNSIYNPSDEAKKWAEQYNFHNLNNIVSMFGFGNGVFVKEILERMRKNDMLIIYEPSLELFSHVLYHYNITNILSDHRIHIAIESINEKEFRRRLQGMTEITNLRNQIICIHPKYDKMFPESCIMFWKEIKDIYTHTQIHINTAIVFGVKFIDNILNNLKHLKDSNTIVELKQILPKNVPAVVVAAGPSVEENIEDLKKIKGKAVIFAVDRILDYLLDMGLEPDFVVTLDPIKPVEFFSKRPEVTIPLLYFMEANDQILQTHKGKKFLCNSGDYLNKVFKDIGTVSPRVMQSASVATVAFTACVEMGFTNIILVGQDLAFSREHTHAGGNDEKVVDNEIVMVEDIHGNLIKSRYDWKMFIIWYQDYLHYHKNITVIDAKVQGARIQGTTVMPFRDAIELYCNQEVDFADQLNNMKPTLSATGLLILKKKLELDLETLQLIKNKSKESIGICDQLIYETKKNFSSPSIDKHLSKLEKINQYILEQPIYNLMNMYVSASAAHYISQMYQFTDNKETNSIQTFERTKCIFKAVIEASEHIEPKLRDAINSDVFQ